MKLKFIQQYKEFASGDVGELNHLESCKVIRDGVAKHATLTDIAKSVIVRPMRVINKRLK